MAASQIDIKIRTLIEGVQGIQTLINQINSLSNSAAGVNPAANGAASAITGVGTAATTSQASAGGLGAMLSQLANSTGATQAGLKNLQADLNTASNGFSSLMGYVQGAAVAFGAFLAVKGVKELADYAARTETLGVTLGVVADNAGYTKAEISGFEVELKKLGITTQAARESMTQMVQAGIPLEAQAGQSASNVARLARAAQDLAVVTGENSSQTLQRLTTNIQQMDTMGLRFMGLTVDIMASQDKYASSIGVTREALTQQQKVMAVNNAVLEQSAKLTGAYEASMDTVGKKVASLKRYQEELANTMGDKLLPAYGAIVDSATNLLATLDKYAQSADKSGEASKHFGESVGTLTSNLSSVIETIGRFVAENTSLIESLASNIVGIISDIVEMVDTLTGATESAGIWQAALYLAGLTVAGLRDGLKLLEAVLLVVNGAFNGVVADILKGMAALATATGLKQLGQGLNDMANSFYKVSQASDEAAGKIVEDFAAGRTATQGFIEGTDKMALSLANFGKAATFKQAIDEIEKLKHAADNGEASTANFGKASALAAGDITKLIESGKMSESMVRDLIKAAESAGVALPEAFSSPAKAMKTLSDEAEKTKATLSSIGSAQSFSDMEVGINALIKAQQRGLISSVEQGKAFLTLQDNMESLSASGALTTEEFVKLDKKLKTVSSNITAEYQNAIKDMGVSAGELATGMSDKFSLVAKSMTTLAGNAQTTAETFSAAFSKGIDTSKSVVELEALSASIKVATERGRELKAQGDEAGGDKWLRAASEAAGEARVKFDALFESSIKSAKTQDDLNKLSESVKKFGDETGASSTWIQQKLAEVGTAATRMGQDVQNADISGALKKIGLSAEEMKGQASRGIQDVVTALGTLRQSANVTGDEYYRAFSKATSTAKSIADLQSFRGELQAALSEGKIGWDEYSSGVQVVGAKFDELFQAQLKAAKTKEDFAQLRAEVEKLGANGSISATQMATALRQIGEQASWSQEKVARLNQTALDNARGMGQVLQAQNNALSAGVAIQKEKSELAKAEAEYARTGSAVAEADVKLKQATLAAAQAHAATEAEIVKLKEMELALQQAIAAQGAAQAAFDQSGSDASRQALEASKQQVTEKRNLVAEQQRVVQETKNQEETTNAVVSSAGAVKEEVKGAADAAAEADANMAGFAASLNDMLPLLPKVTGRLEKAGYSTKEAAEYAKNLTDTFGRLAGSWEDLWIRADDVELKTRALEEAKKRQLEQEAKQAEIMAQQEEQANKIKEAYAGITEQTDLAALGITGWYAGANAVQKAYWEIQKAAASAAKSATDAANSFVSSSLSIHEELLNAQGKEEEAIQLRYASRKQELSVQYEQLKVQIEIARVQAMAAKVSTASLDAAAAKAQASYSQAMSDLGQLESIALKKAQEQKAKAAADAKAASNTPSTTPSTTGGSGSSGGEGGGTNLSSGVSHAPTPSIQSIDLSALNQGVNRMADSAAMFSSAMSDSVEASMGSIGGSGSATLGMSVDKGGNLRGGTVIGASMNAVDVSRVDINFDGATTSVYTEAGGGGELVGVLTGLKNRAMRG